MEEDNKEEIERRCINNVMEYFKNHTLTENVGAVKIIRKFIEAIFKLEVYEIGFSYDPNVEDEKNDILLKFINDSKREMHIAKFIAPIKEKLPQVFINEASIVYQLLENENKKVRLKACIALFRTLFHEVQHLRQYIITKLNISNKKALMYAKECYLKIVLDDVFFSLDKNKGNYEVLAMENNADLISWNQIRNLMQDDDEWIESEIINKEDLLYNGAYVVDVDTKDKKRHFKHTQYIARIDALTEIVNETIDPMYIRVMPILQKEFNLDGSKKRSIRKIQSFI